MPKKLNWNNLTKKEYAEYMRLQMSHPSYGRSGYLPDDCVECGACGEAILGTGLCPSCYQKFKALDSKLRQPAPTETNGG